jgi:hypothetical protein
MSLVTSETSKTASEIIAMERDNANFVSVEKRYDLRVTNIFNEIVTLSPLVRLKQSSRYCGRVARYPRSTR